ncbi:MAG: hypothetical protein OEV55_10420 [candidate division Zixibacteria bacterium]|nr:hypothetical protein [candidate division Zixibacteria bacterium]
MRVKFTLKMFNLLVNQKQVNRITLSWISDLPENEILTISNCWLKDQSFLTRRMTGLDKVGESSLTIEPLEEIMA